MAIPAFLKRKSTYIILAIIAVLFVWYFWSKSKSGEITYETAPVEKRDLVQTVEVTGEIKPAARIDLAFKQGGAINAIRVKVGDKVKKGNVLAELKDEDVVFAARSAKAAVAVAVANLNAKLAGETPQAIRVAETDVEKARAALDKANADLASAKLTTADDVTVAELAVQTAKNNLDNQDAVVTQTVRNSYDSARTALLAALGPIQTGLTDGDKTSGVDDTASNQMYKNVLGFLDSGVMTRAQSSYVTAKAAKASADSAVNALSSGSSKDAILAAADKVVDAVTKVQTFLSDVQSVLSASMTSQYLSTTDLAAKKTAIDTDRVTISAQNTAVLTAIQTVKNSELSKTQVVAGLQDAYDTAVTNLETAKTTAGTTVKTAESNVSIQKAALDAALAALDQKKSGPRPVDVAGLRASVEQAQVNFDKAVNDLKNIQIIAPVDGTVSEVIPDIGEMILANAVAVRMVGTQSYDIEALVPETDIAKVEVGQSAKITLDAFGDDVPFEGTVTAEDPDQTKVQDAIYYKVRVQIDPGGHDIKPGMTSNVTVTTGERTGALVMPLRAIRTTNGTKTVRVLENGMPKTKTVTVGLRGDEGLIEATGGLKEGEKVIVGETAK